MLEIGTIVYLKKGSQKLMVIGRGVVVPDGKISKIYDYAACLYPLGFVSERTYYFNEENVDKVLFRGYHDDEEDRFTELYKKWQEDNKNDDEKGSLL